MPVRYARRSGPGPGSGTVLDPWINTAQINAGLGANDELVWIGENDANGFPIPWEPLNLSALASVTIFARGVVIETSGNTPAITVAGCANFRINPDHRGLLTVFGRGATSTQNIVAFTGGVGAWITRLVVVSDSTGTIHPNIQSRWTGAALGGNGSRIEHAVFWNTMKQGIAVAGAPTGVEFANVTCGHIADTSGPDGGAGFIVSFGTGHGLLDCCVSDSNTGAYNATGGRLAALSRFNTWNVPNPVVGVLGIPSVDQTAIDPAFTDPTRWNFRPTSAAILPGGASAGRVAATIAAPAGTREWSRGASLFGLAPSSAGVNARYSIEAGTRLDNSRYTATNGTWDATYLRWNPTAATMDVSTPAAGSDIGTNRSPLWLDVCGRRDHAAAPGSRAVIDYTPATAVESMLLEASASTPVAAPVSPADEYALGVSTGLTGAQYYRALVRWVGNA